MSGSGSAPDPARDERVMLLRPRRSRIYYLDKLFPYPIEPSFEMLLRLGLARSFLILMSYLKAVAFPPSASTTSRTSSSAASDEALRTFFKSYTEKVGVSPATISARSGRAEGQEDVDLEGAVARVSEGPPFAGGGIAEGETPSSSSSSTRIRPGTDVGDRRRGGRTPRRAILRRTRATRLEIDGSRVARVEAATASEKRTSSRELLLLDHADQGPCPGHESRASRAIDRHRRGPTVSRLHYSGLLLAKPDRLRRRRRTVLGQLDVHSRAGRQGGRIQVFDNWSPWMVRDSATVWIGVEFFCEEGTGSGPCRTRRCQA